MNTTLWIIASVLAAAFALAGLMKLSRPRAQLAETMSWVTHATDGQVKMVGAVEFAGAIGLILPAALNIAPILVPIAAAGLVLTMFGAIATHLRLKEGLANALPAMLLAALCAVIVWGRFGPYAF